LAIGSFRDARTKAVFDGEVPRGISVELARRALRKLRILDQARSLQDVRSPPGNRLEGLRGDRSGQHSIRVNDQYRICFVWDGETATAHAVELVDYH
jgi:toxin HigB-1